MPEMKDQNPVIVSIDISLSNTVKLLLILFFCLIVFQVWHFILLLILSILIAVTLQPLLVWLISHGLSRRSSLATISLGFAFLFFGFFFFLIPPLINEVGLLSNSLPALRRELIKNTPSELGLRHALEKVMSAPVDGTNMLNSILSFGQYAAEGALDILMLLVFSLYFLIDGPRAYRWLLPYFSIQNQHKISHTIEAMIPVISAYISGQLLTSFMAATFSFLILAPMGVPATLSLSILAGIFDILPLIGFFLFAIPACLMALTVSWSTTLWVLLAYTAYHLIETYFIVPKVYGVRMRLSALVILIGIVVANSIAGVLGAIAILPILASYPIIERIWLVRQVGKAAVEEHKTLLTKIN
jgi:predicted PurR-regulated permease PerM